MDTPDTSAKKSGYHRRSGVQILCRVPTELKACMQQLAEAKQRTLTAEIVEALQAWALLNSRQP